MQHPAVAGPRQRWRSVAAYPGADLEGRVRAPVDQFAHAVKDQPDWLDKAWMAFMSSARNCARPCDATRGPCSGASAGPTGTRKPPWASPRHRPLELIAEFGPRGLHAISRRSSWAASAAGRPTASERAGDHADGQRAELAGDGGDKWCGARAGAAAPAGGHEKPGRPARGPPRSPCDAPRRPPADLRVRPALWPRVRSRPISSLTSASDISKAWGIGVHRKGGDLLLSTVLTRPLPESRCAG